MTFFFFFFFFFFNSLCFVALFRCDHLHDGTCFCFGFGRGSPWGHCDHVPRTVSRTSKGPAFVTPNILCLYSQERVSGRHPHDSWRCAVRFHLSECRGNYFYGAYSDWGLPHCFFISSFSALSFRIRGWVVVNHQSTSTWPLPPGTFVCVVILCYVWHCLTGIWFTPRLSDESIFLLHSHCVFPQIGFLFYL